MLGLRLSLERLRDRERLFSRSLDLSRELRRRGLRSREFRCLAGDLSRDFGRGDFALSFTFGGDLGLSFSTAARGGSRLLLTLFVSIDLERDREGL